MKKLFINLKRNEQGAALIIVLLILVIIAALGTAAILTSSIGTKISSNQYNAAQVLQGADTGVQMALNELNTGANSSVNSPNHVTAAFDSNGNRIGTCEKEREDDCNNDDGNNDSTYKAGTWSPSPIVGQIQVPNGMINYTAVFSAKGQNTVTTQGESQGDIDEEDHDHYVDKEHDQTPDDSREGDTIHYCKEDGYDDSDHEGSIAPNASKGPVVYQVTCTAYLHSGNTVTRAKIVANTSKDNLTVNAPAAVYALGNISTAGHGSLNGTGGVNGIEDSDTHSFTGGNGDREDVDDSTGATVTRTYNEDCDGKVLSAYKDDRDVEHDEIDEEGGVPAYEAYASKANVIKWTGTPGFANATAISPSTFPTWLGVPLSEIQATASSAGTSYTQNTFPYNVPGDSEASPKIVYVDGSSSGGNITLSQSGGGFGLLVVNGNLTVTSPAYTWRGLVYVTGNVTIAGSGKLHVHGALMSGGNVISPSGTDLTVSYFSNELLNINTSMKAKVLNWHKVSM